MKSLLAGAALAAVVVTPALADFYIVQEPSTKHCRIVEERPAPSIGVVIGNSFADDYADTWCRSFFNDAAVLGRGLLHYVKIGERGSDDNRCESGASQE